MHRIVKEAVDLEHEFCCTALPVSLVGMNAALMGQYIEYVADRLLIELGCEKLYNSLNPFDWMEMISLQVHTDTSSMHGNQNLLCKLLCWDVGKLASCYAWHHTPLHDGVV